MTVRHFLFDENLLLDLLLGRPTLSETTLQIWDLLNFGGIEGYVTDITLENIFRVADCIKDEDTANTLVWQLQDTLECLETDRDTFKRARALNINFSEALQVICAIDRELDGILTSNPLDFSQGDFEGILVLYQFDLKPNIINHCPARLPADIFCSPLYRFGINAPPSDN